MVGVNPYASSPAGMLRRLNDRWRKNPLDPTFGCTTVGTASMRLVDSAPPGYFYIRGGLFLFSGGDDCTAQSITPRIYSESKFDTTFYVKCAIYRYPTNVLIGVTEERSWYEEIPEDWYPFNFPSPPALVNNVRYYLVAWADAVRGIMHAYAIAYIRVYGTDTGSGAAKEIDYDSFPDPITWDSINTRLHSIYCTYTAPAVGYSYSDGLVTLQC